MVPDFQTIMLPLLRQCSDGQAYTPAQLHSSLADHFSLDQSERDELLPSGRQTRFKNRVHWAITYLSKCGLLERPRRGVVKIAPRGLEVLDENPTRVNLEYLSRFEELHRFRYGPGAQSGASPDDGDEDSNSTSTPDEKLRAAHEEIVAALKSELLSRILDQSPTFFEWLVVELLNAMGFGGAHGKSDHLGRTGDDGVDGVVDQDALGLDRVYVQAKRWRDNNVGAADIRNFFGSLDAMKATKGVFITTASFSRDARETAERLTKRIVLIDGDALTDLMVRFGVGVRVEETFEVKKVDEDFFID